MNKEICCKCGKICENFIYVSTGDIYCKDHKTPFTRKIDIRPISDAKMKKFLERVKEK